MKYDLIFDKKFIKQLPEFDKYDNPGVVSLCKRGELSLDNFRLQIERWFQNLPDAHQTEMYKALRSQKNEEYYAAFYELLFHQYCLEENWEITKHPEINGKTPDFEIKTGNNKFYLEVLTIFKEKKEIAHEKKYHKLLRKIGEIKSEFSISVHIKEWLHDNIDYKKIVKEITEWLVALNKIDGVSYAKKINAHGFNGSITAGYYKNIRPNKDCISGWGYPVNNGPSLKRIKSKIRKKVIKYNFLKEKELPLVLAVCVDDKFLWESAIDWALYGQMTISWEINNPKAKSRVGRDNSGLITPNPGLLGEPSNKVISAIVFCSKNWDRERMTYTMKVFHNPWTTTKLPTKIFEKMPQFTEVKRNKKYVTLEWENDKNQCIVFN